MAILFITQRVPYPPNKGEKLRTYHQIKHLLDKGYGITVACPIADKQEAEYAQALTDKLGVEVISAPLRNTAVAYISALLKRQSLSEAKFYSASLMSLIKQALADQPYTAIVCSASSLAQYIWDIPAANTPQKNIRKVMDFMDLDSDKWAQYATKAPWPMRWVYSREALKVRQLEQRIVADFDSTFFISQKEVDLFEKQQPQLIQHDVMAIGNGIETEYFSPKPSQEQHVLATYLFVGVMDYKPNIDAVLWFCEYVWPSILRRTPNAKFVIAGMSPSKVIKDLARQPSIQVTGFVENILPYFHQADVFVAPFQIARGVQNKVLQAMACGIPVITSSLGAEGIEAVQHEELLIANNANEYMEIIAQLTDSKRYQVVANAAIARIAMDYSWGGQLKLLDRLIAPEDNLIADTNADPTINSTTDVESTAPVTPPPGQCA
jgi:polysaccharide biosynthesis protein PslH